MGVGKGEATGRGPGATNSDQAAQIGWTSEPPEVEHSKQSKSNCELSVEFWASFWRAKEVFDNRIVKILGK